MGSRPAGDAPADPAWHLEAFLGMLRVERGASPNTLQAYRADLAGLVGYLRQQGQEVESFGAEAIHAWCARRIGQGIARQSQARSLSAVRQWCGFLLEEGIRDTDPSLGVQSPGGQRRLPPVLDEADLRSLLAAAHSWPGPAGRRAAAMIEILYATGLRVSELVALRLDALQRGPGPQAWLRVCGKGRKLRRVPLARPALDALDASLPDRPFFLARARCPDQGQLWPSHGTGSHLTRQHFARILTHTARRAGLTKPVTPHTLRHAFATHLLVHGADLRVVQSLLGHASILTTRIYTHLADSHLRDVLERFHPLSEHACGTASSCNGHDGDLS